jgi:hypothetical protein
VSRLDDLPPDLRAVLSLLVDRRKSYVEIAGMLRIEERAVHDRAHAALALLAPREARELSAAQREQVGEYLLGQTDAARQAQTRAYLEGSAPATAWAQALAAELAAQAPPEIPAGAPAAESVAHASPPAAPPPAAGRSSLAPPLAEPPAAAPPGGEQGPPAAQPPSSRRGGAIVLGAIAAVAIIAVALIVGLGGGSSHSGSPPASSAPGATTDSSASTTASTAASSTAASKAHLDATLTLTSPESGGKAVGIVEVFSEASLYAFVVAAEHLPPTHGFSYAAWLYNSPSDAFLLGRGPTVGSTGTLKAAGVLPKNASHYHNFILTEERGAKPTSPGPIVLRGAFDESS